MHQRENGQHVLTVTWTDDGKAAQVQEYIDQFGGSDSAAVKFALNRAIQRELINDRLANAEPKTIPEAADRDDNNEAVFGEQE